MDLFENCGPFVLGMILALISAGILYRSWWKKAEEIMNWRNGVETLTEGCEIQYGVHGGEVVLVINHDGEESDLIYLSAAQARSMLCGLAFQVSQAADSGE